MYEVLFRLIDENNADIAACSYQKVDETGNPLQSDNTNDKDEVLSGDEVLSIGITRGIMYVIAWNKLYKASIFDDIRFPEGRLHEDEFTVHHILSKCSRILSTSARMYMYTQRSGSIMGTTEESFIVKRLDDTVYAFKDRYNFFCSMGRKDLAGLAAASSHHTLRRLLPRISYMKNFRLCNKAVAFTISACLKSGGLMNKLRSAKLLLVVAHNILRDCWRTAKKLYWGLKNKMSYILRTLMLKSWLKNGRRAFVFGAPYHSNMGDQAQSWCIEQWLRKNYPSYRPVILDSVFASKNNFRVLDIIRLAIKPEDIIFLHSGYHTTDLYMLEENLQRKVITKFPDFQITALPQTVNYLNHDEEQNSTQIYGSHKNLVFLCRDNVSYEKAKSLFPNARLVYFPDIVTTMIGRYHFRHQRKGILLCKHTDKEALYSADTIKAMLNCEEHVDITDTTISLNPSYISRHRQKVLEDLWDNFSRYKLVITDRYHGTIFSLIACTPVIVLPSTDHKLSSGVSWFPDEYKGYVRYIEDIRELGRTVNEVLAEKFSYELPEYFSTNCYDKLKQIIEID